MAALIYDLISVQFNGLDVKSNLTYSKLDLIAVLSIDQVYDDQVSNHEEPQALEPPQPIAITQISKEENKSKDGNNNTIIKFDN